MCIFAPSAKIIDQTRVDIVCGSGGDGENSGSSGDGDGSGEDEFVSGELVGTVETHERIPIAR